VIVDIAGDQARLIDRALNRGGLIGAPLVPQAYADEGRERNDTGDDQSDQSRSNAAQQQRLAL
jgi:hypothetical protein